MAMYKYNNLPGDSNTYKTAKNDHSPRNTLGRFGAQNRRRDAEPAEAEDPMVDEGAEVTRTGLGQTVKGTAHTFTTSVRWGAVNGKKDGTEVEATVLGPDHKLGEEPHKDACPNADTLNKKIGKTAQTGYIKGHLLNHHLGGPGNDDRNLTAIPRSTNLAMSTYMEEKLKALVNHKRAFVYFKGVADFATWSGVTYANRLRFQWHQLKPDVGGAPEAVPGTETTMTFDIPRPDQYSDVDYENPSAGSTKGKASTGDPNAAVDGTTAVAGADWNAMVLDTPENLKIRAGVLAVATGELATLEAADVQAILDALCGGVTAPEQEALVAIKKEVEAATSSSQSLKAEFFDKLETHDKLRNERLNDVMKNINGLVKLKAPDQAVTLEAKLTQVLRDNDPVGPYRQAIELLKQQNERLEDENIDFLMAQMSPQRVDDTYDELYPATSGVVDPHAGSYRKKRERISEEVRSKDRDKRSRVREQVKSRPATGHLGKMMEKLGFLRTTAELIAAGDGIDALDWSGLDPLRGIDGDVHAAVMGFLRGGSERALKMTLLGAQQLDPDALMSYLRDLSARIDDSSATPKRVVS